MLHMSVGQTMGSELTDGARMQGDQVPQGREGSACNICVTCSQCGAVS